MKVAIFFTIILFLSCNKKSTFKKKETQVNPPKSIPINEEEFKRIKQDDSIAQLSIGSKFLIFNFLKGGTSNNNKHYNSLLDSIYVTYDSIDNLKTSSCYASERGILHEYFESDELVDDSNTKYFQLLTKLPKIHDFEISIEKVTKKCNRENSLDTQYCLVLSKNKNLIRRYNIGYIDYGDLSSSSKYWFISKDYIIYTRIFGEVAEEDEELSSTFISRVNSYIITKSGHLVSYFNKEGLYKTEKEEGLVKNHLKEGVWIEKKQNSYVEQETYVKAEYRNGLPIGKWHYYKLDIVEDINEEGYIIKTYKQKTDILMMTENYSIDGNLTKREIFDND